MQKWTSTAIFVIVLISSPLFAGVVEQRCEYVQFEKDGDGNWFLSAPYDKNCGPTFGHRPAEYISKRLLAIKDQFQKQIRGQQLINCEISSQVRLGVLRHVFPLNGHHYQRTFALKLICEDRPVAWQYFKISSEIEDITYIDIDLPMIAGGHYTEQ